MSDRPGYLIIVTGPDDGTLELFSAHYKDAEAQIMRDRLSGLIKAPGQVHMIKVPEIDGVVEAARKPMKADSPMPAPIVPASPPAAPEPFKRAMTAEEFAEETRRLLEDGANGVMRDADAPISDGGAFS